MFESFRKLFKIRPKEFLGVDIGTSFLRVVEIERKGQVHQLKNYGEIGTSVFDQKSFRVFQKNTLTLSNKQVGNAIRAICKEAGIQTKEVNFSIPDFCSFFTSFELPIMGKDEISQAVQYHVRPYIPLPLAEVTLDWLIAEGNPSKTPLKILVVAIPNDVINQYKDIADLASLKLKILEPEVFALARSSVKNEKAEKIIGLVDIGARSTTCSILEKGIVKTSYSFNIAGNQLAEIIANSLNINYNEAEEMKRRYGLLSEFKKPSLSELKKSLPQPVDNGGQNIRKVLVPSVDSILEEIKKVFRGFYRREGKETEKIILSGGLISMPGLKEYFSAELKKEVVVAEPFLGIACPSILSGVLKKMGPSYAIAVGLALKGFE